jgi:excisionase family DNA binding protein
MSTRARPDRDPSSASAAAPAPLDTRRPRPDPTPTPERLAYSVDEAAHLTGLSRDLLYDQMRIGNLAYLKVGRRRLITRQHLEQFLAITPGAGRPRGTHRTGPDAP